MDKTNRLFKAVAAEFIGTYILTFFGLGAIHVAVFNQAMAGIWQIAIVFGLAVSLAIYSIAAFSGGHINPAITISFVVFRKFPVKDCLLYISAQIAGAFVAAATLYLLFKGAITEFEQAHSIIRGEMTSQLSAMVYGCYFPNPAMADTFIKVNYFQAMFAEFIGTAFLAFFVFALTGNSNKLAPLLIGFAVVIIICLLAPITQGAINPARDFGPRLFAFLAGWKSIAIPGPRNGFLFVYIISPIIGAIAGAFICEKVLSDKNPPS